VISRRDYQSWALILLAACAAIIAWTLDDGTLARIVAGIALALLIPCAVASRLHDLRDDSATGSWLAASGGLALACMVLLGLFLTVTNLGLTTRGAAVGALLIAIVLALAGRGETEAVSLPRWSPFGLALTVVAASIVVLAFAIARHDALESAQRGTSYAAFVLQRGERLELGLRNTTEHRARFTVHFSDDETDRRQVVTVRRNMLRMIPTSRGDANDPMEIRVTVRVNGKLTGSPMTLSVAPIS
jgi:hypothetical protein